MFESLDVEESERFGNMIYQQKSPKELIEVATELLWMLDQLRELADSA